MKTPEPQPWYRHPWPWILMAGPAIVVVAGLVTAFLAVTTFDGLVAESPAHVPAKRAMTATP